MDRQTILYVDDEVLNLELFEINLADKFDVITAISGKEALQILNQRKDISVVISDLKMPNLNGIDFIKLAKEQHPHVAYYLLTGYDTTPEIAHAIESNLISGCLSKPFNITAIEQSVENAIK
ncbi:MAG: response regulator [Bacteroidales bacterium]